jgi:hypothetical protein
LGQFSKNYRTFYQNNCQKALKNMVLGSGIRDPEKNYSGSRIPDPGVTKHPIPDPGSGSATLPLMSRINLNSLYPLLLLNTSTQLAANRTRCIHHKCSKTLSFLKKDFSST